MSGLVYDPPVSESTKRGWAIAFLILFIPAVIWRAYAVATLWRWFVVPAFGLAPLSVAMTTGLLALVSLVTARGDDDPTTQKAYEARQAKILGLALVLPGWFLLFGLVVRRFL